MSNMGGDVQVRTSGFAQSEKVPLGVFPCAICCLTPVDHWTFAVFVGEHRDSVSSYHGSWLRGMMHGIGTMKYTNGDIYYGDFYEGQRTGTGMFASSAGDVYMGGFFDNSRQGKGCYCWNNGDSLEGVFKDHELFGDGLLTNKKGNFRYEGSFKDHRMYNGKITYSDGSVINVTVGGFYSESVVHPWIAGSMPLVSEGLLLPKEQRREPHFTGIVGDFDVSPVKKRKIEVTSPDGRGAGAHGGEDTVAKKPMREKAMPSPLKRRNLNASPLKKKRKDTVDTLAYTTPTSDSTHTFCQPPLIPGVDSMPLYPTSQYHDAAIAPIPLALVESAHMAALSGRFFKFQDPYSHLDKATSNLVGLVQAEAEPPSSHQDRDSLSSKSASL